MVRRIIFVFCLLFALCVPVFGFNGDNLVVATSNLCSDVDGMKEETKEALGCNESVLSEKDIVQNVLTFMYWIVGIVAVIMIIVSGIMYTTSGGDPARVKKAKDALTVAVIGLIIALLAAVIVNWVTGVLLD